jgi:predicted nucleic acid-binding protein
MSKISIAIDNSVLGDLVDSNLPDNKKRDNNAFLQIIELDHKGIFEIGIPGSTTMIEELGSGNIKREAVRKIMGSSWRLWPFRVNKKHNETLDKQIDCLIKIMQDKGGIDSINFIVSTIHSNYYLTTDYKYLRQFRAQFKKIREKCGITKEILTPSEFLEKYNKKEIKVFP